MLSYHHVPNAKLSTIVEILTFSESKLANQNAEFELL